MTANQESGHETESSNSAANRWIEALETMRTALEKWYGVPVTVRAVAPDRLRECNAKLADVEMRGRTFSLLLCERNASLAPRQAEVLRLLGQGLGNKGIARKLGICEETVKTHLKRASLTLGIEGRAALARWAAIHLNP